MNEIVANIVNQKIIVAGKIRQALMENGGIFEAKTMAALWSALAIVDEEIGDFAKRYE
jgi:hypothetical protein